MLIFLSAVAVTQCFNNSNGHLAEEKHLNLFGTVTSVLRVVPDFTSNQLPSYYIFLSHPGSLNPCWASGSTASACLDSWAGNSRHFVRRVEQYFRSSSRHPESGGDPTLLETHFDIFLIFLMFAAAYKTSSTWCLRGKQSYKSIPWFYQYILTVTVRIYLGSRITDL